MKLYGINDLFNNIIFFDLYFNENQEALIIVRLLLCIIFTAMLMYVICVKITRYSI